MIVPGGIANELRRYAVGPLARHLATETAVIYWENGPETMDFPMKTMDFPMKYVFVSCICSLKPIH